MDSQRPDYSHRVIKKTKVVEPPAVNRSGSGAKTLGLTVCGVAGVIAIGVTLWPQGDTSTADIELAVSSSQDQTPHAFSCPTGREFYAYKAISSDSHEMGPRQKFDNVGQGVDRFQQKLGCDRLYAATIWMFVRAEDGGEAFDPGIAEQLATSLGSDDAKWKTVVDEINTDPEYGIVSYELADAGSIQYDSLGMAWGANPSVQPTLTKFGVEPALNQVLVLHLKNGQIRLLRVTCDLQPSVKKFVNVTAPASVTSIPSTGTTHVTATTTAPPPRTRTTETTTTPTTRTTTTRTTETTTTTTPPPPCEGGTWPDNNGACPKGPEATRAPGNGGDGSGGSTVYGGTGDDRQQVTAPASAPTQEATATEAPTSQPKPSSTATAAPTVTATASLPAAGPTSTATVTADPVPTGVVPTQSVDSGACPVDNTDCG